MEFSGLTFFTIFLWGIEEGTINTHTLNILGFEFPTSSDPFAVLSFIQGVGVFVFSGIQALINDDDDSVFISNAKTYTLVIGIFGILCLLALYRFKFNSTEMKKILKQKINEKKFGQDQPHKNKTIDLGESHNPMLDEQQKKIVSNYVNSMVDNQNNQAPSYFGQRQADLAFSGQEIHISGAEDLLSAQFEMHEDGSKQEQQNNFNTMWMGGNGANNQTSILQVQPSDNLGGTILQGQGNFKNSVIQKRKKFGVSGLQGMTTSIGIPAGSDMNASQM